MGIEALSFSSRTVEVGDEWVLRVLVVDESTGEPTAEVTPSVAVAGPNGLTAAPTAAATSVTGIFRAEYVAPGPGRYTAVASATGHGQVSFVANVVEITDNNDMPTVDSCNDYMGEHSYSDPEVQEALDQETGAQFDVCRIPAAYPKALRGALHRRVQRALAMRHLALAVKETQDGESQIVVPGRDPEVRRLEAPYRKVTVG